MDDRSRVYRVTSHTCQLSFLSSAGSDK